MAIERREWRMRADRVAVRYRQMKIKPFKRLRAKHKSKPVLRERTGGIGRKRLAEELRIARAREPVGIDARSRVDLADHEAAAPIEKPLTPPELVDLGVVIRCGVVR